MPGVPEDLPGLRCRWHSQRPGTALAHPLHDILMSLLCRVTDMHAPAAASEVCKQARFCGAWPSRASRLALQVHTCFGNGGYALSWFVRPFVSNVRPGSQPAVHLFVCNFAAVCGHGLDMFRCALASKTRRPPAVPQLPAPPHCLHVLPMMCQC